MASTTATGRQLTLHRRLEVLRSQWRTARAAGDHAHATAIETAARQVQAELDQPEPAPVAPAEPATAHGWWLVSRSPIHLGCGACRRAPGGPDHRP